MCFRASSEFHRWGDGHPVGVHSAGREHGFDVVVVLKGQNTHASPSRWDGLLFPPRRGEEPALVISRAVDEGQAERG